MPVVYVAVGLLGFAGAFAALELACGRDRGRAFPWRRAGFGVDVAYWFVGALLTKTLRRASTAFAVLLLGLGVMLDGELVWNSGWGASQLPAWTQIFLMLLLLDFTGYWVHRAFHRGWLWKSHAVHHSSEAVDWLSSVRVHPINDLLGNAIRIVPVLALGFDLRVLAVGLPLLSIHGLLLHANVSWDFGLLRGWVASPAFHRWHHCAGVRANYAGLFPVWDRIFGTYHMPLDRIPGGATAPFGLGVEAESVPTGLWGQLLHPFRAPPSNLGNSGFGG